MSIVAAAVKGHVGILGPTTAGDHGEVCGFCYHQRLCGCSQSVMLPEFMSMFMDHATVRSHVDVWTVLVSMI